MTVEIAALDASVFSAYNRCDLTVFSGYFEPKVAFYHDTGGATFDRETMVANTRKYICGKVRRELIPASFHVYPIKDFGAIEEGEHRFCELATGRCEGIAKFVMVWRKQDGAWRITNVLSYGHRAATPAEQSAVPDK
ncbi:MAG: nuclear transport factor 2 family protein [Janthinobacterium lividum]